MNALKTIVIAAGLVVGGAAASGAAVAAERPTAITIATEGAYAPWNFTGPDGKVAGFEVDLANDLCRRMKVTCTIVAHDWDGLIPALLAGKFDAIMASLFITEKRLEVIDFSRPYAIDPSGFAVAKDDPLARAGGLPARVNLNDAATAQPIIERMKPLLKGKTVGIQVSTTNLDFVQKYFGDTVTIRQYKTTEQHDLDLAAGRVDALFAQQTALAAALARPELSGFAVVGPGFAGDVFGKGTAVALRKTDATLKAMFDEAVAAAIADGTVKALSAKWLTTDVTPAAAM